mgnify:CR=1 FL=1
MEKLESNYNMFDWFKKVYFREYANFTGRARRAEYWYSRLMVFLILMPLFFILIFGVSNNIEIINIISVAFFCILFFLAIIPH